jgi:Ca2+-binding RTX toxin-like protein
MADRYFGALTLTGKVQWTDPAGLHQFGIYFNTVLRFENFGGSSSNVGVSERVVALLTSTPFNNGDATGFHFDDTLSSSGSPSHVPIGPEFWGFDSHTGVTGSFVDLVRFTFTHDINTSNVAGTARIEFFHGGDGIGLITGTFKLLKGDMKFSSSSTTLSSAFDGLALTGSANISGTGNSHNNIINGNSGNNILKGNAGNDRLIGNHGNDKLIGGTGSDRMEGGPGDDTFYVDGSGDRTVETGNAGTDRVVSSITFTLPSHVENLALTGAANINGTGNTLANAIAGNGGNNTLKGSTGNDTLRGNGGNDLLIGGVGKDVMAGGAGADRFDFDSKSHSVSGANRDAISGFSHAEHDRIDLVTIDANAHAAGNQAFTYIGAAAFTGVDGQLRFAAGMLQADMTGDGIADFEVRIFGPTSLSASDFLL